MRKHVVIPVTDFSRALIYKHSQTATILFSVFIALAAVALLTLLVLKVCGIDSPLILDILLVIAALGVVRTEWHAYMLSVAHLTIVETVDHTHLRCIKGLGENSGSRLCRDKQNTSIRHHRMHKNATRKIL